MKKILAITTFTLGLSVVTGSALAANNDLGTTNSSDNELVNLEEMATEKGITVDKLLDQLEQEGKVTKGVELTEAMQVETNTEAANNDISSDNELANLEEMATEKGITVDELLDQLEQEGKVTKAVELTEAKQIETSTK
ncbi:MULTISPECIES: hypothetical protein [Lysinibacillus]|uniref:hypothetical protein n=1 Tax=Lysinibacillus TaxID=400634 RepID=UPI00083C958C|nr:MULTISPECIES: hypothetical protein [Lysinibacillus]